ncbi:MAG TPA: molybdate ABC transporter substrate-binding protein [Phaeodactylibacter sp.]|nr:molybdate ABC transporter substrate-binding protein [Phaeodactylibacter sp.]
MRIIILLSLLAACASCSSESASDSDAPLLRVATAANVQMAMSELADTFQHLHNIRIEPTVSSSGKLTAQIIEGAPYHLLLSADTKYPETLLQKGAAVGRTKIYAQGKLVVWTLNAVELSPDPAYLLSERVTKIAVANPKNAPYGAQAMAYLQYYGVLEKLRDKLVYGESVAQTNQYITTRAVDLGITAMSVVLSPAMEGKGHWVELPEGSYQPIQQGAVITDFGQSDAAEASQLFFRFLSSTVAKRIFQRYGYRVSAEAPSTE